MVLRNCVYNRISTNIVIFIIIYVLDYDLCIRQNHTWLEISGLFFSHYLAKNFSKFYFDYV